MKKLLAVFLCATMALPFCGVFGCSSPDKQGGEVEEELSQEQLYDMFKIKLLDKQTYAGDFTYTEDGEDNSGRTGWDMFGLCVRDKICFRDMSYSDGEVFATRKVAYKDGAYILYSYDKNGETTAAFADEYYAEEYVRTKNVAKFAQDMAKNFVFDADIAYSEYAGALHDHITTERGETQNYEFAFTIEFDHKDGVFTLNYKETDLSGTNKHSGYIYDMGVSDDTVYLRKYYLIKNESGEIVKENEFGQGYIYKLRFDRERYDGLQYGNAVASENYQTGISLLYNGYHYGIVARINELLDIESAISGYFLQDRDELLKNAVGGWYIDEAMTIPFDDSSPLTSKTTILYGKPREQ